MALPPPAAGSPAPDPTAAPDAAPASDVLVTITKADDGSYMVYAGDEPDDSGADMSGDDADAMGPGGDASAPQGKPATSIGAALKAALDILNADASSGPAGNADAQFASGFGAPPGGAASAPGQKY